MVYIPPQMEVKRPNVPLVYVGAEDNPILLANQFGISRDTANGEYILTIGQLQIPQLIGSDEEKKNQLEQLSFVAIKVLGRYAMTRTRVESLVAMLQTNLDRPIPKATNTARKATR
jgi:hypothetical protein